MCKDSLCKLVSSPDAATNTAWGCLGNVTWPDAGVGSVSVTMNTQDLITTKPIAGVVARLCRKLDTKCEQPILDGMQSDASGNLLLQVPLGFDGFAELTATGALSGLYFFYPPVTEALDIPLVPILPMSELSTFVTIVGGDVVPGRGHLVLGTYDCLHAPAGGVTFESLEADSKSLPFYMVKGVPSSKATATDSSGWGGFLNLLPGTATLSGKLSDGQTLGIESTLIRADTITYTALLPLPG
jgi:hypothetical protein